MYVTRPLSLYRTSRRAASEPPPEGPHLGYPVIQDEAYDAQTTICWGMCRKRMLANLPFPQNRLLTVGSDYKAFFVPVPGLPLSANRYYVVHPKGKNAGVIYACSGEGDKVDLFCCSHRYNRNTRPIVMGDVYQQVQVVRRRFYGNFFAKAVAVDGIAPDFLRLSDEQDACPIQAIPICAQRSSVAVVGKWYTPFFFIKGELFGLKDQVERSFFYEVTLEQFWQATHFKVRAMVQTESAMLCDGELVGDISLSANGVVWFRPSESKSGAVGLSSAIVERMRWEVARGGWREEEYSGGRTWSVFGCFVLVERFSLRRLDGSLVLGCNFRHTNKIITKWE
ncbi:unnamed protein product [Spirodela intermedia]|uniref:Uncharacterized protein n=1 Tax=Spirodela intermedia TaxID=51605 RepID=A0A7I8LCW1_SPIIN|nr:unnamed protein product [Spirodela intermedia]